MFLFNVFGEKRTTEQRGTANTGHGCFLGFPEGSTVRQQCISITDGRIHHIGDWVGSVRAVPYRVRLCLTNTEYNPCTSAKD